MRRYFFKRVCAVLVRYTFLNTSMTSIWLLPLLSWSKWISVRCITFSFEVGFPLLVCGWVLIVKQSNFSQHTNRWVMEGIVVHFLFYFYVISFFFPDELFTKYYFLEQLLNRDFIFRPGSTKQVCFLIQ